MSNEHKVIEKTIEEIATIKEGKAVIFGCGDLGRIGGEVFAFYHKEIECFFSSTQNGDASECIGKRIIRPTDYEEDRGNTWVLIAIFNNEKEDEIKQSLIELGFYNYVKKESIIDAYLSQNLKPVGFRVIDDDIYVEKVTLVITEKCSLRCKYCGNFVPYIHNPVHYDRDRIVYSMRRMTDIVREIRDISLIGGEAFLHPDMNYIMEALCSFEKVKHITITTNGTVLPEEGFWDICKKNISKVAILLSDYQINRDKIKKFMDAAREYNVDAGLVNMDYTQTPGMWDKGHIPVSYGRGKEENRNLYMTCKATAQCPMFRNGHLYKCSTAAMGECVGLIPRDDHGTVDFFDSCTDEELKKRLRNYILTDTAPLACDYCYSGKLEPVPMGEQICDKDWNINKLALEVNGKPL